MPEKEQVKETIAIIRNVKCGMGDRGAAVLMFDVYVTESSVAFQVLSWGDAGALIEAYGVSDVAQLNGKPCWVDTGTPQIIRFLRAAGM